MGQTLILINIGWDKYGLDKHWLGQTLVGSNIGWVKQTESGIKLLQDKHLVGQTSSGINIKLDKHKVGQNSNLRTFSEIKTE